MTFDHINGRRATLLATFLLAAGCSSADPQGLGPVDAGTTHDATVGNDASTGLVVTPQSLPDGQIGMAYSAQLAASGGTAPYHFTLASGSSLPSGLSLADDGTVSGTPAVAGSTHFDVAVSDSATPPHSGTGSQISINIAPLTGTTLSILTSTLVHGSVGQPYAATLEATGGTAPYSWSVASGALPAGLSLSTDGQLSGDAASAGSATFTVQVSDVSSPAQAATASLTLVIDPTTGTALSIGTTALPDGMVGTAYTSQLTASGGSAPYTWSLGGGTALPSGLTLGADGAISGAPLQAGSTTFSVQVVDGSAPQQTATTQLTINVTNGGGTALSITTTALPHATLNTAYSATVAATGGTPPYGFSVSSGSLPAGLSLSALGVISGTPSQVGSFTLTIQCGDASAPAQVATRSFSLAVDTTGVTNPVSITTTALPNGTDGTAYSAQLAASGGTAPYQWALDPASTLPPGLTLSATGRLSGTPNVAGRFSFTISVIDASSPQETASAALSITIAPAMGSTLVIITTALPDGVEGMMYMRQLRANGGQNPYQWTVSAGALPPGIQLSAGGQLSGTASVAGSYDFNVQVSDASMPVQRVQASLRLTVLSPGSTVLTINGGNLPNAVANQLYMGQLQATGGVAPYHWSLIANPLPRGLTLSTAGLISGTTTVSGRFRFTVQATDGTVPQQIAQRRKTLVIFATAPALAIGNPGLPGGTVGMAYTATIRITGGLAPYHLTVSAGALPPGLRLNGTTFALAGTPTTAGNFNFTLAASDSSMPVQHATRAYTVNIAGAMGGVRITTPNLMPGQLNTAYRVALTAMGGTPPYHWTIANGTLPAGLTLSAAGVLSGTPTTRGTSAFTLQVADTATPVSTAQRRFTLQIQ